MAKKAPAKQITPTYPEFNRTGVSHRTVRHSISLRYPAYVNVPPRRKIAKAITIQYLMQKNVKFMTIGTCSMGSGYRSIEEWKARGTDILRDMLVRNERPDAGFSSAKLGMEFANAIRLSGDARVEAIAKLVHDNEPIVSRIDEVLNRRLAELLPLLNGMIAVVEASPVGGADFSDDDEDD